MRPLLRDILKVGLAALHAATHRNTVHTPKKVQSHCWAPLCPRSAGEIGHGLPVMRDKGSFRLNFAAVMVIRLTAHASQAEKKRKKEGRTASSKFQSLNQNKSFHGQLCDVNKWPG